MVVFVLYIPVEDIVQKSMFPRSKGCQGVSLENWFLINLISRMDKENSFLQDGERNPKHTRSI